MFNDERITIESGKIFKKANILATIIAIFFLVTRSIIYIVSKHSISFGTFGTEICTILCALGILTYGEVTYRTKEVDERSITNKWEYYSKKGKILLIWILLGYSISMIDSFKRAPGDFQPNYILFIFQAIGAIYFYYQFKKNQININYTFINDDKKTYYLHVLKLIGYLAIIVTAIYFTCGVISMIIYQKPSYIVVFLLAAIYSIIGLGLQYLLLSYLEKVDYDDENDHIKKPFLISGMIVSGVLLIQTILTYTTLYIAENGLVSKMSAFIAEATNLKNNLSFISTIYGGIALSYLLSYSLKSKKINKSISLYLLLMIITTIKGIVIKIPIIICNDVEFIQSYYQVVTYINNCFTIIYFLAFGFIIYSLIKDKGYNKYMLLIPIVELVTYLVCIFLSTQGSNGRIISSTLNGFVEFLSWLLFYILVYKLGNKKEDIVCEDCLNE